VSQLKKSDPFYGNISKMNIPKNRQKTLLKIFLTKSKPFKPHNCVIDTVDPVALDDIRRILLIPRLQTNLSHPIFTEHPPNSPQSLAGFPYQLFFENFEFVTLAENTRTCYYKPDI